MLHRTLRGTGLVAAAALTLTTLGVATTPAQAAAVDPAPVAEGTAWLQDQLSEGVVHNEQYDFDDLGLTVDVGLALAELGDDATVDEVSSTLAPQVTAYYTYGVAEGKEHVTAGSLAKATVFAQEAGDDATAYGGQDLVAQLEDRVSTETASAGRIGDVWFPEEPYEADYANTIGQAFAARALDTADSPETNAVTEYLLAQQCEEGFFRLALGDTAAEDCDADGEASPSVDATALALLNLAGQTDDTDVAAAVDAAVAWLRGVQAGNGSFGSDAQITTANANSTGLAGWALGEYAEAEDAAAAAAAAADAAVWVRRHQAVNVGGCTTFAPADAGGIAYDDLALAEAADAPVVVELQDQWRRATAQALPALQWAPAAGDTTAVFTAEYVRAGTEQVVPVREAAPGSTLCATLGSQHVAAVATGAGTARFAVTLPAKSGTRTVVVRDSSGIVDQVAIHALGKKRLSVTTTKQRVASGDSQTVVVKGLAKAETVKVSLGKGTTLRGQAGGKGVFRATTKVAGKPRSVEVSAVGAFDNRRGTDTFRVTR